MDSNPTDTELPLVFEVCYPRGTLVEPSWNPRGTLPQGRPGPRAYLGWGETPKLSAGGNNILGPPVVPTFTDSFSVEGSPTKIDKTEKEKSGTTLSPYSILSNLEDLVRADFKTDSFRCCSIERILLEVKVCTRPCTKCLHVLVHVFMCFADRKAGTPCVFILEKLTTHQPTFQKSTNRTTPTNWSFFALLTKPVVVLRFSGWVELGALPEARRRRRSGNSSNSAWRRPPGSGFGGEGESRGGWGGGGI